MPRKIGHIDLVWSAKQLAEMKRLVEAGHLSIEGIGRRFGTSGHTIRSRAKRFGWKLAASWLRTPIEKRLAAKSHRDKNGCLLWDGAKNHRGYGLMSFQGKLQSTHRIAWQVANGPIPEGKHVCHKCDVRNCIEPKHLWLDTHQGNTRDKVAKGRARGNSQGVRIKLTDEQVAAIRADSRSPWYLSPIYGISYEHIRRIKLGAVRKRPRATSGSFL
jgi:hypothetical protein